MFTGEMLADYIYNNLCERVKDRQDAEWNYPLRVISGTLRVSDLHTAEAVKTVLELICDTEFKVKETGSEFLWDMEITRKESE